MRRLLFATVILALTAIRVAAGDAELGAAVPDFTLSDLEGNRVSLSELTGKIVVLEWFNPDCPFVRYAHRKGPPVGMGERALAATRSLLA